jgi:hypothetical protein
MLFELLMKTYVVKFPCPTRGFFGIYLEAIRCIDYAVTNNLPFYVDLSESNSLYADAERFNGNTNIWDYYYKQSKPLDNSFIYSVSKYEGNIDKIWYRSHFRRVYNRAVKHLQYTNSMQQILHERKETFPGSTIGVHIRKTDHSTEVPATSIETYIAVLKNRISKANYKHIFLATDDETVVQAIETAFPAITVICNNVTRSTDGQPVHKNEVFAHKYRLGAEAILDAYTLSLCNETILTNSNLSYCSLYMNPGIKYTLLDGFGISKFQMFLRNLLYQIRYAMYHNASFIKWHRKWRYFIKRFQSNNA